MSVVAAQKVCNKTLDRWRGIVKHHIAPAFGRLPLQKLTALHIESHYARLAKEGRKDGRKGGLSAQTILHHHRLISEALQKAVTWKLRNSNPADRVQTPAVRPREVTPIDETAAAWLLTVAEGTRLYIPIMLAVSLGLRRGEILAVRWRIIDRNREVLEVNRAIEESKAGIRFKEPRAGGDGVRLRSLVLR